VRPSRTGRIAPKAVVDERRIPASSGPRPSSTYLPRTPPVGSGLLPWAARRLTESCRLWPFKAPSRSHHVLLGSRGDPAAFLYLQLNRSGMPLACLLTLAVAASPRPPTVRRERVTKKTSSVVSRPNQAQSSSRHEGARDAPGVAEPLPGHRRGDGRLILRPSTRSSLTPDASPTELLETDVFRAILIATVLGSVGFTSRSFPLAPSYWIGHDSCFLANAEIRA
jgi:hypothetical protein